jgi:hypothetical protein
MRLLVLSIATLALICGYLASKADAEPLVTISCEKPNGISIKYGTSLLEHSEASKKNQPEPPPSLHLVAVWPTPLFSRTSAAGAC